MRIGFNNRPVVSMEKILEIVDNDDTGLTDEVAFKLSSEHLDWSLFKFMDGCLISKRLESYLKKNTNAKAGTI